MKFLPKLFVSLCLMAAATLMASTAARADSFQIGVGPHGGINFSLTTGGYCDARGCPPGFWDMPVYYCPVYYRGRWYRGPVYYRHTPHGLRFWIRGAWRADRWHGPRPPWACTNRMGPALGFTYYERHGFHMRPEWRKRWMHDHPSHPPRDLRHDHGRNFGPGPSHGPDRRHDPRHNDGPHGKPVAGHFPGGPGGPGGHDAKAPGHGGKPSAGKHDNGHHGGKKDAGPGKDKGHSDKHDDKPHRQR